MFYAQVLETRGVRLCVWHGNKKKWAYSSNHGLLGTLSPCALMTGKYSFWIDRMGVSVRTRWVSPGTCSGTAHMETVRGGAKGCSRCVLIDLLKHPNLRGKKGAGRKRKCTMRVARYEWLKEWLRRVGFIKLVLEGE